MFQHTLCLFPSLLLRNWCNVSRAVATFDTWGHMSMLYSMNEGKEGLYRSYKTNERQNEESQPHNPGSEGMH